MHGKQPMGSACERGEGRSGAGAGACRAPRARPAGGECGVLYRVAKARGERRACSRQGAVRVRSWPLGRGSRAILYVTLRDESAWRCGDAHVRCTRERGGLEADMGDTRLVWRTCRVGEVRGCSCPIYTQ